MKIANSMQTKDGKIYVDCAECEYGGNGDGTCVTGGAYKLAYRGECSKGKLKNNLRARKISHS